jgi:hypothetical protein
VEIFLRENFLAVLPGPDFTEVIRAMSCHQHNAWQHHKNFGRIPLNKITLKQKKVGLKNTEKDN